MTAATTPDAADVLLAKIAAALPGWQVSLTEESDGWVARAVYNRFKGQTGRAQPSRLVAVERLLSRLWFPACLLADERERITALFDAHFEVSAMGTPTTTFVHGDTLASLALDIPLPETRHVYRCARCQTLHDGGVAFDCVCGAMVDYWGGEALPVDLPEEVEHELWRAANFGGAR